MVKVLATNWKYNGELQSPEDGKIEEFHMVIANNQPKENASLAKFVKRLEQAPKVVILPTILTRKA